MSICLPSSSRKLTCLRPRLAYESDSGRTPPIDKLNAHFSRLETGPESRVQPKPTMSTQDAKAGKEELVSLLERCESNRNADLKQKLEELTKHNISMPPAYGWRG